MPDCCLISANDLRDNWPGRAPVWCGEPAIATITFACIHEHASAPRSCAGCAAEIQQAAGLLICPPCEDSADPHECLGDVRITWDEGTVTVVQKLGDEGSG
jgi:hypothetical protein